MGNRRHQRAPQSGAGIIDQVHAATAHWSPAQLDRLAEVLERLAVDPRGAQRDCRRDLVALGDRL